MEGKKKLIIICCIAAAVLAGGILLTVQRCNANKEAEIEQEAAQVEAAQQAQRNAQERAGQEADQKEYEKRQEQIEKSHQQAQAEQQEDAKREADAIAANTRYSLDEADKLEEAGLDSKCAAGAMDAFTRFCAKKKLDGNPLFDSLEVTHNDDGTTTIPLSAEKYFKGGSKTVNITGTYDGEKLTFAVGK